MAQGRSEYKTILVLDDDPQFHRLVVPVLTGRGHRVLSAQSGQEASNLLENNDVDLAIVDGELPDINGIDWISQVRAAGNPVTVLFVSAYWRDAQSYHKLTKELAVSLVLHKPVLAAVFGSEVDILLRKRSATDESQLSDFEDMLLALRAEYAQKLPLLIGEISSLVEQIKKQPNNDFLIKDARNQAHKLRGTAASYGFPDIGEAAAGIEESLIELQLGNGNWEKIVDDVSLYLNQAIISARAAANAEQLHEKTSVGLASIAAAVPVAAMVRILVVDDDASFLDLLDQLARPLQIQVLRASCPVEALDMACMYEVDAALMDVDLGSSDSAFKLALELRALPGYADLPLAFLSGTGHIEPFADIDRVGQCLYIERPLKSDAMQSAIDQLLAIRHARRPRVLLIDDDAEFANRTGFVLTHEGMQVHTLCSTVDIVEQMQWFNPDILLLDVMMPGVSGFDICRMLRTVPRWRDLPIVFLTANRDIDTRVACLRCGGDDYLSKPVINEELFTRVHLQLERVRQLRGRVERDNVTGLLRRAAFMEQLSAMLSEASRRNWHVNLAFLQINQLPDCAASDSLLTDVGSLLLKRLRPEDLKGRWDQGKLILAFRHEEDSVVRALLAKIVDEASGLSYTNANGVPVKVSLRIGMSRMPVDGGSIHELLSSADRRVREKSSIEIFSGLLSKLKENL